MGRMYQSSLCEHLIHLSDRKPTGTRQKKTTDDQLLCIRDSLNTDVLILIAKYAQHNKVKKQALSNLHTYRKDIEKLIIDAENILTMIISSIPQQNKYMSRMQMHGMQEMKQCAAEFASGKYYMPSEFRSRAALFELAMCDEIKLATPNHRIVQSAIHAGYLQ
ncbi:hypothetical protein EXVG_00411 [Emiliania huxleyi virus 202]|nr:hypothetical protein EXVG_00411 [Emiliania huxleyi virus 202]AHA55408.1 hypothetical protein EhV156_00313 [Emiliania huxleyi virus 156]